MMMNSLIRPESEADFAAIHQVNALAFGQENEAVLVEILRESDAYVPELSLVAMQAETVVGHILFSKIMIESETGSQFESLTLAPMAVLPECQGLGIGSALVRAGLEAAKGLGFRSVIVLGHAHYYPRHGFFPAAKWKIKAPFEVPESVFMALELVPGGLQDVSGTVRYPKAFEMV